MNEIRYIVCLRTDDSYRTLATLPDTQTARRVARRYYESRLRRGKWSPDIFAARIGGGVFFDFPYNAPVFSCGRLSYRLPIYTESY